MNGSVEDFWVAGVDGCAGGWVAVFVRLAGDEGKAAMFSRFVDVLTALWAPKIVTVDIPIGLPERAGHGGRAAENAIRPLLGQRQSSVFSVPSRAAIYVADYRAACQAALANSDPPRKISKQLFNIAPKIREVDTAMRADATLASRVFEVHPELAFWQINGERPLTEPKKLKNRPYVPGLAMRRSLLAAAAMPAALIAAPPPNGAADDDMVDALACAAVARRICTGRARSFPDPPPRDRYGLPMAIWA